MDAPWTEIPDYVLRIVHKRLPCLVDRRRMGQVCRSWRAAVASQQHKLPSILVPSAGGPSFSCAVRGCATHRLFVPAYARAARYFGAYGGGWLFLAVGQYPNNPMHMLLNLHTKHYLDLPRYIAWAGMVQAIERSFDMSLTMDIKAATLSSPPEDEHCVGAAISSFRYLMSGPRISAFWRTGQWGCGDQVAVTESFAEAFGGPVLEDVIHHNGAFCFLTNEENLNVFASSHFHDSEEDGELVVPPKEIRRFLNGGRDYGLNDVDRYLVESRGHLLMATRLRLGAFGGTWAFRVFEMEELPQEPIDSEEATMFRYTWKELKSLDGRMLFLGRGCSKSYEVADYPGFEVDLGGVYFLDDRTFYDEVPIMEYLFRDSGKWLPAPDAVPRVVNFLPEQGPSSYSPPAWLLP